MEIEIDFEVFQALTALRQSETDSYNSVIRRLLKFAEESAADSDLGDSVLSAKKNATLNLLKGNRDAKDGAWIGKVLFPNGTRFRANYKGKTHRAEIRDDVWVDEDGKVRRSPSEAASAISGTQVNGWRFWFGLRPSDDDWRRLDEFRK